MIDVPNTETRSFDPRDLDGVVKVLAEALPADSISRTRFVRQILLDANFRIEGARVAVFDHRVVGFCLAMARQTPLENAPPDSDRGYITLLGVRPGFRKWGIGTSLLKEAEAFLQSQGRPRVLISPYAPGYFTPGVDVEAYAEGLAFLVRRGYSELYRPIAMSAPLWNLSPPQWVAMKMSELVAEGVRFTDYDPLVTLPLLEFVQREFPGDWVRVVRETIGKILGGDSPGRLIIAQSGEQVLGFAHCENERFGPMGVAASERGRGLGQALMFRMLQSMREQGFRAAWFLWSDDRTADRLYNGAGFRIVRRFAVMSKKIG